MFETQSSNLSAWERLGKYRPIILILGSVAVTPIALAIGLGTAAEGDFTYTKIVFPYTVLSLLILRGVSVLFGFAATEPAYAIFFVLFIGISLVQFPTYGVIASLFCRKRLIVSVAGIILVHFVFVIVAFVCGYFLER